MILHELAANSAKYGALSSTSERLFVNWQVDDENDTLSIDWLERGGPSVSSPKHNGFGSTLVERLVSFQFDGEIEATFPSSGFVARLRLPLRTLRSPA
ncbi:MAG: sensor histidine kinase [Parvularcula sp.]|jgi:two-component sensor histidine kinase|nr:sensor histidine kinase [Parvularcula sp.]